MNHMRETIAAHKSLSKPSKSCKERRVLNGVPGSASKINFRSFAYATTPKFHFSRYRVDASPFEILEHDKP